MTSTIAAAPSSAAAAGGGAGSALAAMMSANGTSHARIPLGTLGLSASSRFLIDDKYTHHHFEAAGENMTPPATTTGTISLAGFTVESSPPQPVTSAGEAIEQQNQERMKTRMHKLGPDEWILNSAPVPMLGDDTLGA